MPLQSIQLPLQFLLMLFCKFCEELVTREIYGFCLLISEISSGKSIGKDMHRVLKPFDFQSLYGRIYDNLDWRALLSLFFFLLQLNRSFLFIVAESRRVFRLDWSLFFDACLLLLGLSLFLSCLEHPMLEPRDGELFRAHFRRPLYQKRRPFLVTGPENLLKARIKALSFALLCPIQLIFELLFPSDILFLDLI